MQTKLLSVLAILSVLVTGAALADGFKPAVVYDIGGKFDKSFNESVWRGVRKFTGETGIEVKEFQITNETQREQAMRAPRRTRRDHGDRGRVLAGGCN